MEVICEIMRLKPANVKDYINLHDKTWPDLVRAIRDSGFLEEYIYILNNLVVVIMKCENFKDSNEKLAKTEIFRKWTAKVRSMLIEDKNFFHTRDLLQDIKPIWRLDNFDHNGFLKF